MLFKSMYIFIYVKAQIGLKKVALESFWIQKKKSRKPIEYSRQKIGKTNFVEKEFFVHVFQRVERLYVYTLH